MPGTCTAAVFICGAQFSGDICLQDGIELHSEACHSSGVLEGME